MAGVAFPWAVALSGLRRCSASPEGRGFLRVERSGAQPALPAAVTKGVFTLLRLSLLALVCSRAFGAEPANLAQEADASIAVDSVFPGYTTAVLTNGQWVELGREATQDIGRPDYLGNGGNTWVSEADPSREHWVEVRWPESRVLSEVTVLWSRPEWFPRAFRVELLRADGWAPAPGDASWYAATGQRTVVRFPAMSTRAVRILQPPGGCPPRGLMAAQEVQVRLIAGALSSIEGARPLTDAEVRRLAPARLEPNIARLAESQPGAAETVVQTAQGVRGPCPLLADGDRDIAAGVPDGARSVGVEWPIPHVIDGVTVSSVSARPEPVLPQWPVQVWVGGEWVTVRDGLAVEPSTGCARLHFEPIVAQAVRIRLRANASSISELEVHRYLPAAPNVWPRRLVEGNGLERQLLASGREVSYADLCRHSLSMRPARALLGLKDGADEVGVAWDGRILGRAAELEVSVGDGDRLSDYPDTVTWRLLDGWRPATVVSGRAGSIAVTETAFVYYAARRPALFLRVEARNCTTGPADTRLEVRASIQRGDEMRLVGSCLAQGDRLVLTARPRPVALGPDGGPVFERRLAPGQTFTVDLVQPLSADASLAEALRLGEARFDTALDGFRQYWDDLLAPAARIEVPEEYLNRLYRAVLTQLLINADGDIMPYGAFPSVYDGSLFGVEEGFAMTALAQFGLSADAQRYMDGTYLTPGFLRKVEEYTSGEDRHQQYRNGLQPSYAVRAYRLTRDRRWIEPHLPLLRKCAEWTIAERRKTMTEVNGERPLHYGLLPEWAYGGDIGNVRCYALYANLACLRGLYDTAWLMDELGDREAASRYAAEAVDYAGAIERAMEGNVLRDRTPPFLPLQLYATGPIGDDYDQLFDGCLLDLRALDTTGPLVRYLTDYLEAENLTFCRLPRFRRDAGPGGLDAIYSIGYLLTKLQQDRVGEFLLGFYGFVAFNMDRDTFASRETNLIYASDLHARSSYVVPDSSDPLPCSSAVALQFLRNMLVTEQWPSPERAPEDLLLLAGAPRAWFEDGKRIRVSAAPTDFGPVSFEVVSHVAEGRIAADVIPPQRDPWHTLQLRLRHPKGARFARVTVNGRPCSEIDANRERVVLRPGPARFRVIAEY